MKYLALLPFIIFMILGWQFLGGFALGIVVAYMPIFQSRTDERAL